MKTKATATLIALTAGLLPLTAQDATPSDLREQIQRLDQKVRALEQALESTQTRDNATPSASPAVALDEKGLRITSGADTHYALKIGALIQADARFFLDNGGENGAHRDSFLLRRVRLPFFINTGKHISFFIQPEFAQVDSNGGNTQLTDAWAEVRPSTQFGLKFGKYPGPVALETPANRHFIEATFTNQLVATRDIGLEASGTFAEKTFTYRLGLYNGAPNNSWSENANLDDGDFSVGGRLAFRPFSNNDNGVVSELTLSIGGSYGHEAASTANGRIRSYGQQTLVNPATAYSGNHLRIGPAIEFYHGPFSAIAELMVERWTGPTRATNHGWRVTTGYVLTGENAKGRVTPAAPFSWGKEPGKRTWGAVEILGRISGLKVDDRVQNNTHALSYGTGLAWYLTRNLSLYFDVVRTDFGSGINLRNETAAFSRLQINF
ncbi:MAG: OprO/OprP family phosphate-selective porin [Puniceicoccales bacterium]|jgi:phosphate-selective porin OprO/OprP|nr:OprO/OprP family phosphate-selective porin [Puniceicoccales bacterium]